MILSPVINHHTSYEEDAVMIVCNKCHAKIHFRKECRYKPVDSRPIVERKFKLVPCSTLGCPSKARIVIGADASTAKCYRCKQVDKCTESTKHENSGWGRVNYEFNSGAMYNC